MARPSKLVMAGLLALLGVTAHAGYAQLAPPEGFSGSPGGWKYAPAANDSHFGKIVHQPNGLKVPVPGAPTTMPAGYRFAANAPRVAAGLLFMNPYVRTGIGIAAWLLSAKLFWDEASKQWKRMGGDEDNLLSDGNEYRVASNQPWFPSMHAACNAFVPVVSAMYGGEAVTFTGQLGDGGRTCLMRLHTGNIGQYGQREIKASACPAGWYQTPAGCVQTPPPLTVTQPEFEDLLAPKPMPDTVPWELPYPSPLPVEEPFINPAPGPNPAHRPRFVPTGDPVPNPNYDPNAQPSPDNQPYTQPGVRVKPSPTPDNPFRVDIEPVNVPKPTAEPNPEEDGEPSPGTQPKPEEQKSLCEKHPDIVACEKLGTPPTAVPVPNVDKTLEIKREEGWGPSNGTCPAPKTATIGGVAVEMPFTLLCDFATGIRPVILALAWLSAVMAFMGLGRKE